MFERLQGFEGLHRWNTSLFKVAIGIPRFSGLCFRVWV